MIIVDYLRRVILIRCRQCGKECVLRSSQVITLPEDTFQTKREYKCIKCGSKYEVVDDPVKIVRE